MDALEALFSSRVRLSLLKTLFAHPQERFYGRELARLSGERQSAVWRELQNLEQAGLVWRREEASVTYFGVQVEHPLFGELRSLLARAFGWGGVPISVTHSEGVTSKSGLSARELADERQLIVGEND